MSRYARLLGSTDGIDGNADEAVQSLVERFVKGARDADEHGVTHVRGGDQDPHDRVWEISLHPPTRAARKAGTSPTSKSSLAWIRADG